MKFQNRKKGNTGEDLASKFLEKNGWKIIDRNFSVKWGEIDIIASKEEVLSFIEVKAKTGDHFGTPEGMINKSKLYQINRMADLYLGKNPKLAKQFDTYRIDVVAIVLDGEKAVSINYYENVGGDFI